jgi:hypothetical protein
MDNRALRPLGKMLAITGIALVSCFGICFATVTLTQGTIAYNHGTVNLNPDHSVGSGGGSIPTTLNTLVLENEYLRATVVPSYGARVISLLYKPTGHEELWANPNAALMQMNAFYYNWLLVWGGIFPAWGAPEHGKYWFLPWDYSIVKQNSDTVSIAMYMTDSIPWRSSYSSGHSAYGASGIKCTFTVTLITGKTGIAVDVSLVNPGTASAGTEYWTCTTVSPGSVPGNLRLTDGAEMIMPDDTVKIVPGYNGLKGQEQQMTGDWYMLNKLRWWKNWVEQGIVYAQPKSNFWGIINHDAAWQEGIMRLCDNRTTTSCKIWTCGHGGLPYWEPWGGISPEFYTKATFAPNETKSWHEFFTPSLGLDSVTHASDDAVVNLKTNKSRYDGATDDSVRITCQMFCTMPARLVHANLSYTGAGFSQPVYDADVKPDSLKGNPYKFATSCKQVSNSVTALTLVLTDNQGRQLLNAVKQLTFVNCAATPVLPFLYGKHSEPAQAGTLAVYSLDGRKIAVLRSAAELAGLRLGHGAYVVCGKGGEFEKLYRFAR